MTLIGEMIFNEKHGQGRITDIKTIDINNSIISIEYADSNKPVEYIYPDAFNQILKFENTDKLSIVLKDKEKLNDQRKRLSNYKDVNVNTILAKLIGSTKKYLNGLEDLTNFNEMLKRHNAGNYNYSDYYEQHIYLLRYFYAYYYEYLQIANWTKTNMDVTGMISIGCGSGVDALSLKTAFRKEQFNYVGIDIVKWDDIIFDEKYEEINIITEKINGLTKNHLLDNNVLNFPKSLSDIKENEFIQIKEWIEKSICNHHEVCISASFTCDGNIREKEIRRRQIDRYEEIIELFVKKGYIRDWRSNDIDKPKEEETNVWKVDKNFSRPCELIGFFNGGIENCCKKFNQNKEHCRICEKTNKEDGYSCRYINPKYSAAAIHYRNTILSKKGTI